MQRPLSRTGGGPQTETTSYAYDDLGRLQQVTLPDGTVRMHYFDLDFNRAQIVENAQTVATYAHAATKIAGSRERVSVGEIYGL